MYEFETKMSKTAGSVN